MIKHVFLLCAAAVCTISVQAMSLSNTSGKPLNARQHLAKVAKEQREANTNWLPGTITTYHQSEDEWLLTSETKLTYDEKGRKLSEKTGTESVKYVYDDNGNLIQKEGDNGDSAYSIKYNYDPKTNRLIGETSFRNDGPPSSYSLEITRDYMDNITRVDDFSYNPQTNRMDLNGYTIIEYIDGKATSIVHYNITEGSEEIAFQLSDIVWKDSDGQIIINNTNDMDLEDYFMGSNRVESAIIRNFNGEGFDVFVYADYLDDNGRVSVRMMSSVDGQTFYTASHNVIDSYGSYSRLETKYELSGGQLVSGNRHATSEFYYYDAYGILINYGVNNFINGEKSQSSSHAEVTYDPTYGYPLEATIESRRDNETLPTCRNVYSDYAEYSSVESIIADDNAPVEYFNLQGMRVENPTSGIYIRRQGSDVKKVMVK